jgi:hypothetical protein
MTSPFTWHTRFRATDEERAFVVAEQAECEKAGIVVSLNDVLRHLARRSAIPAAVTREEARDRLLKHWQECDVCENGISIRCIDGLWFKRDWRRLLNAGLTPETPTDGSVDGRNDPLTRSDETQT